MKAVFTPTYGPASTLEIREIPVPSLGERDVLVQIFATPVTAGDRRMRSANFPGMTAVPGRLMMGVFRPRQPIQGTVFAGRVSEVGAAVTRFAVGDEVFGFAMGGVYAEYLSMPGDGPLAALPPGMDHGEAAAIPYGAGTALTFLRDMAVVQPGERVLILGASGGVGRYAVQLAKHMGAEVTAVCGQAELALVRDLGADHALDYRATDFTQTGERYDVIFDLADATSFSRCRGSLTERGRYVTVAASLDVLFQMAWTRLVGGPRALFGVDLPTSETLEVLRALMAQGVLRPTIAARYPLARIADAHAEADSGRLHGEVVVEMRPPSPLRAVG